MSLLNWPDHNFEEDIHDGILVVLFVISLVALAVVVF